MVTKYGYCRPSDFPTAAPAFSMITKYFADARPTEFSLAQQYDLAADQPDGARTSWCKPLQCVW
jgi:hypothetical protein